MSKCIFCQIAQNELTSYKIYEKDGFIAFLDINPNTFGATIVIPSKHISSSLIDIDYDTFKNTMIQAKKVAEHLAIKLKVQKVGMAIEGTGVDHFHVKLYPFHQDKSLTEQEQKEKSLNQKRVFNKYYKGYLTTQLGPQADIKDLQQLAIDLKIYC